MEKITTFYLTAEVLVNELGIVNLASITIGVVGILLSVLLFYLAQKKRKPLYAKRTVNLISESAEKINSLQINFDNRAVSNVSVTHIAIWNGGRETINQDDVPKKDQLIISSLEGVEILEVEKIYEKNPVNNFRIQLVQRPANRIKIFFDYFDYGEGVILRVIHSGTKSGDIIVSGTVKKAGAIKNINGQLSVGFINSLNILFNLNKFERVVRTKRLVVSLFLFVIPVIPLLEIFFPEWSQSMSIMPKYLVTLILILVYWPLAYIMFKQKLPKGFELFDLDFFSRKY